MNEVSTMGMTLNADQNLKSNPSWLSDKKSYVLISFFALIIFNLKKRNFNPIFV